MAPENDQLKALTAAKRFLTKNVGRGSGFVISLPELARMTGIKERTLKDMRSEAEPQGISLDQSGRLARAFDQISPGLGAMFLTAAFGGYGYATHRSGEGDCDPMDSAAAANDYASTICRAVSPKGPGKAVVTTAEADAVLGALDRAVAAMMEVRGYFARRRGS